MTTQAVSSIRKRFKNEWLLIRVVDFDRRRTLPLTGELIAHSKNRDELYPIEQKYQRTLTLIMHSDKRLPAGYGYLLWQDVS